MPQLTERDKRTIRLASIGIAIYLVLFFGFKGWRKLETGRANYRELLAKAQREQLATEAAENRVLLFEKLKDTYHLDPRKLPKETLLAEASSAIQKAAMENGFGLGPIRESAGRTNGRELSTITFDGAGPLPGALTLLQKLQTLGYPLVIDSLQLTQDPTKPGMLKMNAVVVILNFEQWKGAEVPSA